MNAFGRQTAPPQSEVVSVTSALRPSAEALRQSKDSLRASAARACPGTATAELFVQHAPVIVDAASRPPFLSTLAVNGA